MAFDNDSPSIETRFQLNTSPNEIIRINDNTDYVATYGIALADVIGALKITSPIGTVFHNTVLPAFDIDLDVQTYIDTIELPTDSNGVVLKGTYTVEYTVRVSGAVDPGDYTKTFLYDYCDPLVDVQVGITVNLIDSQLTSTDNTAYPVELTNNTRTHEIFPPSGLDPTDWPVSTVSTEVNTYSPITTKTWTGKITNILELTFPASGLFSEYIIDVTVTGNSEKDIQDDINICNLQCNMRALTARYSDALANNPINAVQIANDQLTPALINAFMYTSNIACGNFDLAETYYQEVLTFTGSSPDCECSDSDVPTLILASGGGGGVGSNTYVVDVCNTNSALSVVSNTIGDETTYTICFDDTIWTKINALTETTVTSADGTVIIVPTILGYAQNYDLSVNTASPTASPVHSFAGILDIDMTNAASNPPSSIGWRANWSTTVGDKLQEPTIVNVHSGDWTTTNNEFYLSDYIDQAGGEYPKPQFEIVGGEQQEGLLHLRVTDLDTINNRIYFSFFYANGNILSNLALSELSTVLGISVLINA